MDDFGLYLLSALCLIFVIEGLLYALFPDAMRRMMAAALQMPADRLRQFGGIIALGGFSMLWMMHFIF